jgi:hypothetical protein
VHEELQQCEDSRWTGMKPKPRTAKAGSRIIGAGVSSEEALTGRAMNYWLEKINPEDIARLWMQLEACAKGVLPRTTWVQWVNGTIDRAALRVDVTACTTQGGFVLSFTVSDTSTPDSERR